MRFRRTLIFGILFLTPFARGGDEAELMSRAIEAATQIRERIQGHPDLTRLIEIRSRWLTIRDWELLSSPQTQFRSQNLSQFTRLEQRLDFFERRLGLSSFEAIVGAAGEAARSARTESRRLGSYPLGDSPVDGSWGAQFPELLETVRAKRFPLAQIDERVGGKPIRVAVRDLISLRNNRAKELMELAERQAYAPLRQAILRAADRIHLTSENAARVIATSRRWGSSAQVNLNNPEQYVFFCTTLAAPLRGEIANLDLALRLEDVVHYGKSIKEIPEYRKLPLELALLDKEIDVVFKGGRAWAEAKNVSITTQQHQGDRILDQAIRTVQLRDQTDSTIELHMYFYAGVVPEIAEDLRILGWQVHGIPLGGVP